VSRVYSARSPPDFLRTCRESRQQTPIHTTNPIISQPDHQPHQPINPFIHLPIHHYLPTHYYLLTSALLTHTHSPASALPACSSSSATPIPAAPAHTTRAYPPHPRCCCVRQHPHSGHIARILDTLPTDPDSPRGTRIRPWVDAILPPLPILSLLTLLPLLPILSLARVRNRSSTE
jgi:hypothetical protein